jgi:hypothetical protein
MEEEKQNEFSSGPFSSHLIPWTKILLVQRKDFPLFFNLNLFVHVNKTTFRL